MTTEEQGTPENNILNAAKEIFQKKPGLSYLIEMGLLAKCVALLLVNRILMMQDEKQGYTSVTLLIKQWVAKISRNY